MRLLTILFTPLFTVAKDEKVLYMLSYVLYPTAIQYYAVFFNDNVMSCLLLPLFCFWTSGFNEIFQNTCLLLRIGNCRRIAAKLFACAGINAICYTLLLNLTALPAMLGAVGQILAYGPFFIISILSQMLFFYVCALLFLIVSLLTEREYISFLVVILYGIADIIGSFQRFWFRVGLYRSAFKNVLNYLSAGTVDFSNIVFLIALIIGLSLVTFYVAVKRDYFNKSEDGTVG
jgi:hypothetical protein